MSEHASMHFFHQHWTEHAVKWYQDKVRTLVTDYTKLEAKEDRNIDFSIPQAQSDYNLGDELCKLIGPELEW